MFWGDTGTEMKKTYCENVYALHFSSGRNLQNLYELSDNTNYFVEMYKLNAHFQN
jgi:hypothetical protein